MYFLHFIERDPSDPYQRPIVSDAKGYYAYLPAIFIYQDLQYNFLDEMDQKYYAVGHDKHIFIEQNGQRVNKTFPGVAVLYLPFFLMAHLLASIFGLAADGYSDMYQYLFDFGQFFYATLGLVFLGKILKMLNFSKSTILISVLTLVFGTNLWFYIAYDQSVTHIYNFFLINALVLCGLKLREKATMTLLALFAVLSLLVVVFFVPQRSFYANLLLRLKSVKTIAVLSLVAGAILSIPLFLWKIQSGNWIVYSYGEEGFDFVNPEIFNFLFSYAKGWFLYSPLILIVIIWGSMLLFKENREGKVKLLFLILFMTAAVYVFSSWWCWWYGFSFGQRPMVDFYVLIGFLIALIWQNVKMSRIRQLLFGGLVGTFVFLNILQSYQHHHGFFQWSQPNSEIYWDNFLRFKKKAKVYKEEDWKLILTEEIKDQVLLTDRGVPFSESVVIGNSTILKSDFAVISFNVTASSSLSETDLVIEYKGDQATYRNYNFNNFTSLNQSTNVQLKYDVKASNDTLVLYFWNKDSAQKMNVDFIRIDFYTR